MANSDDRYEMLPYRELCKLSWVVQVRCEELGRATQEPHYADRQRRDASIDDLCF